VADRANNYDLIRQRPELFEKAMDVFLDVSSNHAQR
jgi:hypothetical protein